MNLLTIVYALLLYSAALILIIGLGHKILQYARTPAPLKIPTTPAPITHTGVVARMFREVVLFESLFKASLWTWLFGWTFHAGLLLALLGHLRFATEPVWAPIVALQPFAKYAAFVMLFGLAGLALRRVLVDRVRYISAPSDYLMLLLFIAIGASGLWMRYLDHTDIVAVKRFILGTLYADWQPLPADGWLLTHLSLVILLLFIFPFSKLLHAPGVFFSPTRNQRDNPREQRHVAAWAKALESSARE